MNNIFTIGHGAKPISQFLQELQSFDVRFLVDVRSKPYSRSAQFNREQLMRRTEFKYVFMGSELGGFWKLYDEKGRIDYKKVAEEPRFKAGIQRLITAHQKGFKIALMCSEADPCACHRAKLIGTELYKLGIPVSHIVGVGR